VVLADQVRKASHTFEKELNYRKADHLRNSLRFLSSEKFRNRKVSPTHWVPTTRAFVAQTDATNIGPQ
jgi:hypothetical protein